MSTIPPVASNITTESHWRDIFDLADPIFFMLSYTTRRANVPCGHHDMPYGLLGMLTVEEQVVKSGT